MHCIERPLHALSHSVKLFQPLEVDLKEAIPVVSGLSGRLPHRMGSLGVELPQYSEMAAFGG